MTKKGFLRILIFYLIGITLSNVFRFDLLNLNESGEKLSIIELLITSPLGAIGLFIGALISLYLLKKERKLSFSLFGTSWKWSLIMLSIPVILLAIFGVDNENNINIHLYGMLGGIGTLIYCFCEEIGWRGYLQDELKWSLIMLSIPVILLAIFGVDNENNINIHLYGMLGGIGTLIYCFCEEIGWRGYLQDELKSVKEWKRILLIGFLWYLWHLSFITNQNFIDIGVY